MIAKKYNGIYVSKKDTSETVKLKHEIHITRLAQTRLLNSLKPAWVASEKIRHHNDYIKNKDQVNARSKLWQITHPKQRKLINQRYYNKTKLEKMKFPLPASMYSKLSRVNSQCKDAQSKTRMARDNK